MYSFPPVPARIQEQMEGKKSQNFCVFLTRGAELFVRCFHRYYHGELVECNRYVFAKDGCVRYLWYGEPGCGDRWRVTRLFREPIFFAPGWYSGRRDNSYVILNADAYKKSEMKYCELDSINTVCPMEYLRLYIRHPNIEYLIKAGYHRLLKIHYNGWYCQIPTVEVSPFVNLKSNNLLKMLDLNRDEFKALRGRENFYDEYLFYRKEFTGYKPAELLEMAAAYHFQSDALKRHSKQTGMSPLRLARYLNENNIAAVLYGDYIAQCEGLGYNLHDTAINMPHDFDAIHNRLSALIKYKETEELRAAFEKNYADRLCYEYSEDGLTVRLPKSMDEIVQEGAALSHCVGGYAKRHANGQTTILFLRRSEEPDTPYYTMEIDKAGNIRQCYGYKNNRAGNPKPPEIKTFEKHYEQYLQEVIHDKRNQRAARQSA